MAILVGTERGLLALDGEQRRLIPDRDITHAAAREGEIWVLADGADLLRGEGSSFDTVARLPGADGTWVLPCAAGVLVGAADARLFRLEEGTLAPVAAFDEIDERDTWYTPWGGPPDVRSIAEAPDGMLFVNVHVGGILRSRDAGATWVQTIDIDADVHQVIVAPDGRVLATGASALSVSEDAGDSWAEHTRGFDHTYMRAVAVADSTVLVTAARDHSGGDPGVYRRALKDDGPFERCSDGLPDQVSARNIDTAWLSADAALAAFATAEGDVWGSTDEGRTWGLVMSELPPPRCLLLR